MKLKRCSKMNKDLVEEFSNELAISEEKIPALINQLIRHPKFQKELVGKIAEQPWFTDAFADKLAKDQKVRDKVINVFSQFFGRRSFLEALVAGGVIATGLASARTVITDKNVIITDPDTGIEWYLRTPLPFSAIVGIEDGIVKAYDWKGNLITKGEAGVDDASVIQKTLDSLTPNRTWKEKVILLGEFVIDNSTSPLSIPSNTIIEVYGKLIAQDHTKTMIEIKNAENVELIGGVYDGNRGTESGEDVPVRVIHVDNSSNVILKNLKAVNGYSRGIEIDYPDFVILENVVVDNCWRNIMHWVKPADLATHDDVCIMHNIKSINAINNGLDGTSPVLIVDGYYSRNCGTPIAIDGFRRIIFDNIDVDKGINITTGAWEGNMGADIHLNNIFAKKIYMAFNTAIESIKVNNITLDGSGGHGWEMRIKSDSNVSYVELNNVEIKNFSWSGLLLTRDSDVTGIFENVILNNIIARDGKQRGFNLNYIDHLKLTNCIARGNDWRGFIITNSNYVKMVNCSAIKTGAYSQDGPLDLDTVNYFKAIGCFFEYGGVHTTLTNVTNYDFINCEGDYPLLRSSGVATFSGDGSTTDFLIDDHGLAVTDPSKIVVKVTPISQDAIAASPCIGYVDPNDNTKIRVKFASAPASGTDNVKIVWEAQVVS